MSLSLIFFVLVTSVIFSLLEIQIEGGNGWAGKLPTWKIRDPLKGIINFPYISGYHLYFWILLLFILHFPLFFGISFNIKNELSIIEVYVLILLIEDFMWFVFNPKWGVKKFFTESIPWQAKKLLYLPQIYWIAFVSIAIIEFSKQIL